MFSTACINQITGSLDYFSTIPTITAVLNMSKIEQSMISLRVKIYKGALTNIPATIVQQCARSYCSFGLRYVIMKNNAATTFKSLK